MRQLLGKMARFGIVGGVITAFNYWLYISLISIGLHYLIATTLGWLIGVMASFFGNKYYTFLNYNSPNFIEVISFFSGNIIQLIIGSITLIIIIDVIGIDFQYAFFFNVAITAIFSFLFMDRIVFGINSSLK